MIKNSIRNKLILFLLTATMLPIAASLAITYLFTKATVSEEAVQMNTRLLSQGKTNLTHYLDMMLLSSLAVYHDVRLYDILNIGGLQSDEAIFMMNNEIYRGMQTISHVVPGIVQVYLYLEKSNRAYVVANEAFLKHKDIFTHYKRIYEHAEVSIEPTHPIHSYGMVKSGFVPETKVLTLHRTIQNALSKERLGKLSIDFNMGILQGICQQLYTSSKERLFLLDATGKVIYGPNEALWGKVLNEKWTDYLVHLSADKGSFDWADSDFSGITLFQKMQTPYMNWTIVKQVPYSILYKTARDLTRIHLLIAALLLVVVAGAAVFFSLRITTPIKKLIRYMTQIQTGQLNIDIEMGGNDELAVLGRRFRGMMQTINDLILREYRLELANKSNELKALQAQTNPHFINNVLQSIGTLALQHKENKIYSLIASLGKMMRYSMNTYETIVPLKQEIEYLKAYLNLQEQRFGENLHCDFDTCEEVIHVPVPKMILQPIVENYFKHGFNAQVEHKKISIHCTHAPVGWLRIEIEDNGRGMSANQLERIQQRLNGRQERRTSGEDHIGLINVLSRLRLYFNDQATMELRAVEPHGLKVILSIPFTQEENPE
jgi:two-component system sensor histidine kinase YesM